MQFLVVDRLSANVLQKADLYYTSSLVSLFRSIKKAVEIHEDLTGSSMSPAELLIGCFTGIEVISIFLLEIILSSI